MTIICTVCKQPFVLSNNEKDFYKKFNFEPQNQCFGCNQRQKLSFRNGRTLYRRICDGTGESIISIYSSGTPFPVYKREYWYSDTWDAISYGREIDFSRPFFEQYKELQNVVPRIALLNVNAENSEYCNMSYGNKNCYYVFGGDFNEDTMYAVLSMRNRDTLDSDYSQENEQSYWLIDSYNCYGCRFTLDSKNCNNCAYISDCSSCSDSILCTNLTNSQYCIRNQQLTKEEYEKQKEAFVTGSFSLQASLQNELQEMRKKRIVKYMHAVSCENCTGDYLKNSSNCENCFSSWESQDMCDIVLSDKAKDCFRSSFVHGELCYEVIATIHAHNALASYFVMDSSDVSYCETVINCHDCFGCNGLRQKQYCILNKQYTKEEYDLLHTRLIEHMKKTGEWGNFFPKNLSCFGYNETAAQEIFPLTKEEAQSQNFRWKETEEEKIAVEKIMVQN